MCIRYNRHMDCSVDYCTRAAVCRGYCNRHYENWRLRGDPIPLKDLPLDASFNGVGWTVTEDGCWEWNGTRNESGYGLFSHSASGYTNARAHRVSYELTHGSLSTDDFVLHSCDNPPCVNPEHLRTGDHDANMADVADRRRSAHLYENNGWKCPNGHDMSQPGSYRTVTRSNGYSYRSCIECARARSRRYSRKVRSR